MAYASVQEIFENILRMDPSTVQGVNGVLLFDFGGEGGGKWTLILTDDEVKLDQGESVPADVTFAMEAQDFVAIANGDLNPISAFMQGKVKVSGDMALAMRLQSILTQ